MKLKFGNVEENVVTREEFPLEKAREVQLGKITADGKTRAEIEKQNAENRKILFISDIRVDTKDEQVYVDMINQDGLQLVTQNLIFLYKLNVNKDKNILESAYFICNVIINTLTYFSDFQLIFLQVLRICN